MSTHTQDLWPTDIATTELRSPVAILREQATLLADKTEGLVIGQIRTGTVGGQLQHTFMLVAPTLGGGTITRLTYLALRMAPRCIQLRLLMKQAY